MGSVIWLAVRMGSVISLAVEMDQWFDWVRASRETSDLIGWERLKGSYSFHDLSS